MVTLDSFDLADSNRSLANGADPSAAPLMRLYLMAPAISGLFFFAAQTRNADTPPSPPPPRPGLFVGLTLAES